MPLSPMELEESWRLIDLAETDNFAVLVSLAGLNKTRHMENASPLPKRTILFASCAAVPGTGIHSTSARPAGSGSGSTPRTMVSASVSPERFNLLPL